MAKFLNTSAITYYLEELIKNASERLVLVSPYLKLNNRIKELLEDKNRLKIDVRIVYGKSELSPNEAGWLKQLEFVRTSFCENLHAKCYLSEKGCIISSLNLYEFSQVNNNEMGVYLDRETDADIYRDTYEEVQRLIRISDEVRIAVDKVNTVEKVEKDEARGANERSPAGAATGMLTVPNLAKKLGIKRADLDAALLSAGYITVDGKEEVLTAKGHNTGAKPMKGRFGNYILWPDSLNPMQG